MNRICKSIYHVFLGWGGKIRIEGNEKVICVSRGSKWCLYFSSNPVCHFLLKYALNKVDDNE